MPPYASSGSYTVSGLFGSGVLETAATLLNFEGVGALELVSNDLSTGGVGMPKLDAKGLGVVGNLESAVRALAPEPIVVTPLGNALPMGLDLPNVPLYEDTETRDSI
jgi:hypothetical protein